MSSISIIGQSSRPRSIVVLNNNINCYPKSWTIAENGHGVLDDATVTLPIQGNPDIAALVKAGQSLPIAIYAGFPSNPSPNGYGIAQLSRRFIGTVDASNPKFGIDDQTVELTCMAIGGVLARNKTTTLLGNTTTVQYIQRVCAQYGLTANVQLVTAPATMQEVFSTNQMLGVMNLRIFDLLVAAALTDGVYIWCDGKTLNYCDPTQITRVIVEVPYASLTGPKSFDGQHALQYSKNIKVEVRSYAPRERQSFRSRASSPDGQSLSVESSSVSYTFDGFGTPTVTTNTTSYGSDGSVTTSSGTSTTNPATGSNSSGLTSTPSNDTIDETYIFHRHGLTQARCDALAVQYWKQLSAHEFRATFVLPVTPTLLPNLSVTAKFHVTNTPWASFRQDYLPMKLTETFSDTNGYTAEIVGINHALPQGLV